MRWKWSKCRGREGRNLLHFGTDVASEVLRQVNVNNYRNFFDLCFSPLWLASIGLALEILKIAAVSAVGNGSWQVSNALDARFRSYFSFAQRLLPCGSNYPAPGSEAPPGAVWRKSRRNPECERGSFPSDGDDQWRRDSCAARTGGSGMAMAVFGRVLVRDF